MEFKQLMTIAAEDKSGATGRVLAVAAMSLRRTWGSDVVNHIMKFCGMGIINAPAGPHMKRYIAYIFRYGLRDHIAAMLRDPGQWHHIVHRNACVISRDMAAAAAAAHGPKWAGRMIFSYVTEYIPGQNDGDDDAAADAAEMDGFAVLADEAKRPPLQRVILSAVNIALSGDIDIMALRGVIARTAHKRALFFNLSAIVIHPVYPYRELDMLFFLASAMATDEVRRPPEDQRFGDMADAFFEMAE